VRAKRTIGRAGIALALVLALAGALGSLGSARPRHATPSAAYVPGEVLVGYAPAASAIASRAVTTTMGIRAGAPIASGQQLLHLRAGESVQAAVARLRRTPGVAYAVPNFLAHASSVGSTDTGGRQWIPDDTGRSGQAAGWEAVQWNFLAGAGVDAPGAWANLRADHRPGGQGVVVAIVDTGVAYRRWKSFRRSPDFNRTHFIDPYDFVAGNAYPLDRNGHGTFVAGTVAESTNNHRSLTGLAYGATIMPVRVLNASGWGDAATISKGIRYAINHGAQVINLSLEFDPSITGSQIPEIISALQYAHRKGVVVVAASGNEGDSEMAYPARSTYVISVGATTKDRCLAQYSNTDRRLDLVAPGGGADASLADNPNCRPYRTLPSIHQMTFPDPSRPTRFGLPNDWFGTSMSAAHVSAVAALVIASGVIGPHPTPDQVLARLETTAQALGTGDPNPEYGYGLVDAAAATARSG
jgi:serine protease